jgi:outer membrane assembly lipoprotein YfiO
LIYTPGEGWTYEPVGSEGKWKRDTAKGQLIIAQDAFDREDYGLALKAARHVVKGWPLSDYSPQAQELLARSYDALGNGERAFKEYQKLLDLYSMRADYNAVARQQFNIANQYLGGKWFKLWGLIPYPPPKDKVAGMYKQVVENGPYSEVGPEAQMKIGETREQQKRFPDAVAAYETAADRYFDRPDVAADALFRAGLAYNRQTDKAEYDQSLSQDAIATLTDFLTLYPEDDRTDDAERIIGELKREMARGHFQVARFYESRNRLSAALIYYNEALFTDPLSPFADQARERIETLKDKVRGKS